MKILMYRQPCSLHELRSVPRHLAAAACLRENLTFQAGTEVVFIPLLMLGFSMIRPTEAVVFNLL